MTTRERGFILGKWIGYIIGCITISSVLITGVGKLYAGDERLRTVEAKSAIMPAILWDTQLLKADARSHSPAHFDSLVINQIQTLGPRPEIRMSP